MKLLISSLLFASTLVAAPAFASTLTFDTPAIVFAGQTSGGFVVTPVLSIFGETANGIQALDGTIAVTRSGGGDFEFEGVDLADASKLFAEGYTISGYLNGVNVFTDGGTLSKEGASLSFSDLGTAYGSDKIDTLTITVDGIGVGDINDVSVVPTPEPSSLALLGTGIAGLASLVRRRARG